MPILGGIWGALRIQMWNPSNIHYVLRMKLNEYKEEVNEEDYGLRDSNSSSVLYPSTEEKPSKTQDKHPVCCPYTRGILRKTRSTERNG